MYVCIILDTERAQAHFSGLSWADGLTGKGELNAWHTTLLFTTSPTALHPLGRSSSKLILPYVTQDNTHPGPTFKARLLHIKQESRSCTERSWKDQTDSFPKTNVSFGIGIVLGAEQPSFENRSKGCVIFFHVQQATDDQTKSIYCSSGPTRDKQQRTTVLKNGNVSNDTDQASRRRKQRVHPYQDTRQTKKKNTYTHTHTFCFGI